MEYKILDDYLRDNNISISSLSKRINVSRQTIYDWKSKGIIPLKYKNIINEISDIVDEISCQIEIDIEYGNNDIIIDSDGIICFQGDKWVFIRNNNVDKECILNIDNIRCNIDKNMLLGLKLYIIRYETEILYVDQNIKYILFCSNIKRRKQFICDKEKKMYFDAKNALLANLKNGYSFSDIVNYVKLNELDIVLEVNEEQMDIIYKEIGENFGDNPNYIFSAMGVFIRLDKYRYNDLASKSEKLKDLLDIISVFDGYYRYLNIILICPNYINSCLSKIRITNSKEGKKRLENISFTVRNDGLNIRYVDLLEKVFLHECGHLVFSYNRTYDKEFEERRANYFASFVYNGKYDFLILHIIEFQSWIYRSPLLKPDSIIYYYTKKLGMISGLSDDYRDYHNEEEKLYVGK